MVKVSLHLEQNVKLSQMQRLTIQMMTLHGQELQEFLHEQVTENPLLDIRYHDIQPHAGNECNEKPIEAVGDRRDSLEEMLMKELRVQTVSKEIMLAAGLVIQSLNEKGFFQGDLEDIGRPYGLTSETMTQGLTLVQSFEPAGIAARSIQEALLIQARRCQHMPIGTERVLEYYYDDFLHGRWQKLEKELPATAAAIRRIRDFLKTLSLQPVLQAESLTDYIRADIEIFCDAQGKLQVRSLEELPEVFFRDDLYEMYRKEGDKATHVFIRNAKRQFLDLQTALAYRWQSIFAVMQYILIQQQSYFLQGDNLRPLRQIDIAQGTGLSTATVSRVCRNRYVLFKQRIYSVQSFLAHFYPDASQREGYISDKAIMREISRLIAAEDECHPWSDQRIATYFAQKNIHIARRTVTKFRLKMNIPNSSIRKRLKKS